MNVIFNPSVSQYDILFSMYFTFFNAVPYSKIGVSLFARSFLNETKASYPGSENKQIKDKIPYKCQQCDYSSSQAKHLRKHIDAVHEGIKKYNCQLS